MRYKILSAIFAVVIFSIITVTVVLATSANITDFLSIPTNTTMSLTWTKSSYSKTVIQYSSTTQPLTPSDGTNIYSGTGNNKKQTGLTAGVTYYYSAWGWDGASTYSASPDEIIMTTLAGGGSGDTLPTPPYTTPVAPSSAGWFTAMQPFSGIVQNFENSWGMATDNMQFTMGIVILLLAGIIVYIRTKSSFIAIAADFVVDFGLIGLGLLSLYTIGVVFAFGLGIWGLENIWI